MKISTLTHTYPRFRDDINAPFVESLMEHISAKGHDVSVLTAYDPEWKRDPGDHTVDLKTYRYIWPEKLHILGYSRTIEGNVRFRKRIYLLSPFMIFASFINFLFSVIKKKPDILHAHWIVPNGFIAACVSKLTGIPLLIQTHGSDIFTSEKNAVFRFMARFAGVQASYIISPSPEHSLRLGALGIDRSKIGLVPNTVETGFSENISEDEALKLREKLGISSDKIVILALGRMVYVKGFDYLLRAFKTVTEKRDDAVLVLAGDGVLYDDLKKMSQELGIADKVFMPGAVMRDDVPLYFRMADIFTVPSVRHESGAVDGLPVVIPEAMAAGLPIAASDLGGIPVVIRDGFNGRLVKEKESGLLADALLEIAGDKSMRLLWGERSIKIIRDSVNYDTISDYFISVYRGIALDKIPPAKMPEFKISFGEQ